MLGGGCSGEEKHSCPLNVIREKDRQTLIKYSPEYINITCNECCEGSRESHWGLISWQTNNRCQGDCGLPGGRLWAAPVDDLTWSHVQNYDFITSPLPLPWHAVRMPSIWALPALSRTEEIRLCWKVLGHHAGRNGIKTDRQTLGSFLVLSENCLTGFEDLVQSELPNSRCTLIQGQRKWMLSKADYLTLWIICSSPLH